VDLVGIGAWHWYESDVDFPNFELSLLASEFRPAFEEPLRGLAKVVDSGTKRYNTKSMDIFCAIAIPFM
jgi:hypothetical protein